MGLREGLSRIWNAAGGEHRPDGLDKLHVGDAAYDDWDIVRRLRRYTVRPGLPAVTCRARRGRRA